MKKEVFKKILAALLLVFACFSWMSCDSGGGGEDAAYPDSYIILWNNDTALNITGFAVSDVGAGTWDELLAPDYIEPDTYLVISNPDEFSIDMRLKKGTAAYEYITNQSIENGKVVVIKLEGSTFTYGVITAQDAVDAGFDLSTSKKKSNSGNLFETGIIRKK